MRVVLTRARADAARTAARLVERGDEAILAPVLAVRALPAPLPGRADGFVATSAHAFLGWAERPADERAWAAARPLFAVGAATAGAGAAAGFRDVRRAGGDADGLVRLLRLAARPGDRLVYLAGRDRKPALEAGLAAAGLPLAVVDVYEAAPVDWDAATSARLAALGDAGVLHFSRRSAELFLANAHAAGLSARIAGWRHVAISDDAAAPLRTGGLAVAVAARPDETELLAALRT
ncbi:MAG: uroporphyrinogen-III synthase [Rhizobiales bacterium]|nr:uroporphyrinogen-III synthase [Hyphomicrobiales bacterium]